MLKKIGHFELLSELSKSPFGAVYKANDPSGQTIALKAIQLSTFGARATELEKTLLQEVESAGSLTSPNITPLLGAGEMDGQFCASMEYVQGNSIATMLARKEGFSIWDLLDIGRQICGGLDYAHSHNVFHFSLEPSKIMCCWDGAVKMLSLGASSVGRFVPEDFAVIPSFMYYMSPEQVRGEAVDGRSNLFSLGVMFYEMVTDRRAFDGENLDSLRRSILESTPVAPLHAKSKMHPLLSDLIMKAIEKDPAKRYQSGRDLLNDLENCKELRPQSTKKAPEAPKPPAPAPKATAAAASASAAGATGSPARSPRPNASAPAVSRPSVGSAPPPPKMSSAVVEPEIETFSPEAPRNATPKIAVDPLIGGDAPSAPGKTSFSEISELPPLKETYVVPAPPPSPEQAEIPAAVFRGKSEEKPRIQPREAAQKAIKEIKKVPPQLMGYSVAAAIAVIAIIGIALALRIHLGNSDDDSSAAPAPTTQPAAQSTQEQKPAPPAVAEQPPAEDSNAETAESAPAPSSGERSRGSRKRNRPAPVVIPGQISVESNPGGAQIQIDGQTDPTWVTPLEISSLEPGQHSLVISKSGYLTDSRKVEVASGSKSKLVIHLSQLMATLAVTSNPPGAAIYVDSHDTGRLTPARLTVDKGQHVILIRKMGYLDETASPQFVPGQTVALSPALRPLGNADSIHTVGKMKKLFGRVGGQEGQAKLTIHTQPKGAQVAINQHILDKNSPVDVMVDPGNYVVDITLTGYAPVHTVVTADRDGKVTVDEILKPQQ